MSEIAHSGDKNISRWKKIGGMDALREIVANGTWAEQEEANDDEVTSGASGGGTSKAAIIQEKYPDLYKEMVDNNVPLDPNEFKESGYRFIKHGDGSMHVAYPTPEYREWLEAPEDERGPRPIAHHEGIEERREREEREEKQYAIKKENERMIPDKDRLDEINRTLNLGLSEQEIENMRKSLPEAISEVLKHGKYNWSFMQMSKWAYRDVLEKAIASGKTDLSDEACSGYVLDAILENNADEEISAETKIATIIVRENADRLITSEKELEHFMTRDKNAKQGAIGSSVYHGTFPTGASEEEREKARKLLDESGLEPSKIMRYAFLGYTKYIGGKEQDRLEAYDNFFGLSSHLIEMMGRPYSGLSRGRDGEFYLEADSELNPQWNKDDKITKGLRVKLKERYKQMLSELADRYGSNSELLSKTERALEMVPDVERERLIREIAKAPKREVDFEHYFSIRTMALDGELGERIVREIRDDEYHIIDNEALTKVLLRDKTVDIDYRQIWQNALKQCLSRGYELGNNRGDVRYLTEIFETESFKKNQAELGINFEDPEIFELAFNGFINLLKTQNGEKSAAADWYYENIFANDPGKFLAMDLSFREHSDDRGAKGKLTSFLKRNPQAFEDRVRAEAEKRLGENIDAERHAIKSSILRKATRGDIKKIIDTHKKDFIRRMQKRLPDEISTFTGEKTIDGEKEESDDKKRKETPFDFGYDKAHAMERWADYIEELFPNCNLEWFVDFFPGKDGQSFADRDTSDIELSIWENEDSYFGFSFEYDGKRCVIANSLNLNAAMYLWRGELNEDFKELFDTSKFDAKRTDNPRIADVDHLDKEHFDDSLDLAYKKAFLFFKTGDNTLMHYNHFDGDSRQRREQWHLNQQAEFPAFPLGVDNYSQYPEDIAGYREWQSNQAEIEKRIKNAMAAGGPEMARRESERIAKENAERLYNETLANT